jgi:hypothetical protein
VLAVQLVIIAVLIVPMLAYQLVHAVQRVKYVHRVPVLIVMWTFYPRAVIVLAIVAVLSSTFVDHAVTFSGHCVALATSNRF